MTSSSSSTWPRVVLLGDSLTQQTISPSRRWGAMLANALQRRADVLARGFSGYTSRNYRRFLPEILGGGLLDGDGAEVAAVLVFLGANDGNDPEINPWQAVPIEEYVVRAIFL